MSEASGPVLASMPPTLYEMMNSGFVRNPQHPALIALQQQPGLYIDVNTPLSVSKHLIWTHAQLQESAELLAVALQDQGLQPGNPVAVFADNSAEWCIVLCACLMLNCPVVNGDPRMVAHRDQVRHVLDTSGVVALVVTDDSMSYYLEKTIPAELKDLKCLVRPGHSNDATIEHFKDSIRWQYLGDMISSARHQTGIQTRIQQLKNIPRMADDVILIFFTSGTTGLPKGCEHTNRSYTAAVQIYATMVGASADNTFCLTHPVSTIAGPCFSFAFLTLGATLVLAARSFDTSAILTALEETECTHMSTAPTMLQMCFENPRIKSVDTRSLRIVTVGASNPLYSHVKNCYELLGARMIVIYGLTETAILCSGMADLTSGDSEPHPSAGLPGPGTSIKICDPETNELVPQETAGELHLSGPSIIRKYMGDRSPESFYEIEGTRWFRTGDEAIMSTDGKFRITGRYKDLIIRGGVNVSAVAIENLIAEEFNIDSQVVALPDDLAGEVPVAIVKAQAILPATIDQIKRKAITRLGKNYALDAVVTLTSLNLKEWPMTINGKIRKVELRKLIKSYFNDPIIDQQGDDLSTIKKLWSETMGLDIYAITNVTSVMELGDSLTINRLAASLQRYFRQPISLHDLIQNPTVQAQEMLIKFRRGDLPPNQDTVDVHNAAAQVLDIEKLNGNTAVTV